ncbi:VOC family protein [Marinicella rhabdoformis]|uniref:VOC family protein n=1 Tax=Marinicella rhabdoformis TaxID=2580566 RepID=UPI0012AEBBA2|nr:VOC family protein [Marinicella rhabdoformis]
MNNINIYLHFEGNCKEAFDFYQAVFQTEILHTSLFSEMPQNNDGNDHCTVEENDKDKIMHISLPINDRFVLMGCDTIGSQTERHNPGNNFALSVNPETLKEAERVFAALSDGGEVTMPLEKSFWGSYFGMLTDPFGIQWMVNFEIPQDE